MGVTYAHRAEYALFRLAEEAAALGTWDRRVRLGSLLGRWWHALDRRHRAVARDNAARAFPDWSPDRVASLVRANFEHLGATAGEFAGLGAVSGEELLRRVSFSGREHLEEAQARGHGVFLLGGHVGNWELAGAAMAASGCSFHAVGRRLRNPLLDRRVTELRERFGGHIIPHRNAVRPIFKALAGGGLVAFLMDQRALAKEGVLSEFFGRPVSTNQGLALLALKTGAPVVPAFDERVREGHVVRFHPALEPPGGGSREERVRLFTRAFDRVIEEAARRRPEQWFWVHNRWRLPQGLVG